MITELVFSKEKLVCVKPHNKEFGVVGVDRKGFICFSCTFGCHSCSHVEAINSLIDNQSEETPDFLLQMVQSMMFSRKPTRKRTPGTLSRQDGFRMALWPHKPAYSMADLSLIHRHCRKTISCALILRIVYAHPVIMILTRQRLNGVDHLTGFLPQK